MIEPARDSLTLGSVDARCQFLGPAADGYAVERRLDRVAREALPEALAAAVAERIGPRDGVIRIDRIELNLMLSREMFESSALPRLWADRIGAALAAALAREGGGIAWFAGHAEFVAAYLEHRFAVAGHPDFAFEDFAPLAALTPAEAAAELLAARPEYLAALARSGAGRRDPAWLARRLGAEASAQILDRVPEPAAAPAAAALALVRRLIAQAPPGWRALPGAAAALALVLVGLADPSVREPPALAPLVPLARAIAAVAQLASDSPEWLDLLEAGDSGDSIALLPLNPARRREAEFARRLFARRGGKRIAQAVHAALGTRRRARAASPEPRVRRDERRPEAARPSLDSPFAGFALLLPVICGLDVDALLSPGQARALIVAILDPPDRMAPHAEALADLLLPFPIEPELPAWPPAVPDDPASAGPEAWAARLLDAFADRLPGLAGSSAAYLRRQFLHVGGTLDLEPERLTVRLVRPPLAIVLTIAGMIGERGRLPWRRERTLRILMP